MPEGDTIFRAAQTLHRVFAGRVVTGFSSVLPYLNRVVEDHPLAGRTIESVVARGKHLLIAFSGNLILHTHMRMNGSWHIYPAGERWKRPVRDMRILIETETAVAVGFNIPVAEFIRARELPRHEELRRLGPDLLSDDFDEEEARRRIQARPAEPIAEVLINQRVVAGIGNVYKSEVLFACRINPFVKAGDLGIDALQCLITTARRLLLANVHTSLAPMTTYTGFRRTTGRDNPGERLWVYGRAGHPCRRCGTAVKIDKRGADARLTYWCPKCQGAEQRS